MFALVHPRPPPPPPPETFSLIWCNIMLNFQFLSTSERPKVTRRNANNGPEWSVNAMNKPTDVNRFKSFKRMYHPRILENLWCTSVLEIKLVKFVAGLISSFRTVSSSGKIMKLCGHQEQETVRRSVATSTGVIFFFFLLSNPLLHFGIQKRRREIFSCLRALQALAALLQKICQKCRCYCN